MGLKLAFLCCVAGAQSSTAAERDWGKAEQWVVAHLRHDCCRRTWFRRHHTLPPCCSQPCCVLRRECSKQEVFKCCTIWESYVHSFCHFSQGKAGQLPRKKAFGGRCLSMRLHKHPMFFIQTRGHHASSNLVLSRIQASGVSCTCIESWLME